MTDTMFTRTALTEAAEKAGVTTDQARTVLEAAGVTVQPEKSEPGLYLHKDGRRIIVDEKGGWWHLSLEEAGMWWMDDENRWGRLTPARVVPEGEPIDLDDVREGDRVRMELIGGDEVTFTVTETTPLALWSKHNDFPLDIIRTVHLLHREEA